MGQYWRVINLDKEEMGGFWGKLPEFLFGRRPEGVVNVLTVPAPIERSIASVKFTTNRSLTGRLGYLQFPDEILEMIFSEFSGVHCVACLSVTNSHLLQLGIKHTEKLMKSKLWISDRIICIGDYVEDDDLPQGLLAQKETQELKEHVEDPEKPVGNLYSFVSNYFEEINFDGKVMRTSWQQREGYRTMLNGLESKLLRCLTLPSYEGTGPYVLCNISKWEYVRGEAITELTGATMSEERPDISGALGFGRVLFTQICWSSDCSTSMRYDGPISRGVWAGDRMEIVRMNEMPSVTEVGKEWTDVSQRVLCEAEKIWNAECGKEWRD